MNEKNETRGLFDDEASDAPLGVADSQSNGVTPAVLKTLRDVPLNDVRLPGSGSPSPIHWAVVLRWWAAGGALALLAVAAIFWNGQRLVAQGEAESRATSAAVDHYIKEY